MLLIFNERGFNRCKFLDHARHGRRFDVELFGKGVCGAAAKEGKTQIVVDVNKCDNHIACDPNSQSEIVVPIFSPRDEVRKSFETEKVRGLLSDWRQNKLVGVLDMDCPVTSGFNEEDREGLERLVKLVAAACDWYSLTLPIRLAHQPESVCTLSGKH